jgi:hypothetical protein
VRDDRFRCIRGRRLLLQTPAGQRIEQRIFARNSTLHKVHLLDVDFAQILRRLVREAKLAPRPARKLLRILWLCVLHTMRLYCCSTGFRAQTESECL